MLLNEMRLQWLKTTRQARAADAAVAHIVIAATFTPDPLIPYLGVKTTSEAGPPRITVAPYDQIIQLCLNWRAMYADQPPTAIVILWRIEDFARAEFQAFLRGDSGAADLAIDKIGELTQAIAALRRDFPGTVIVSVPPFPHGADHHIRAARTVSGAGFFHRLVINRLVKQLDEIGGVSLLDLDAIQRFVGIEHSFDAKKWYLYRQPFTEPFWHEVASDLALTLGRQRNAAKKCIVVDCDNTLWGGVIGEDGLEGIALGDDFPGWAFRDFQQQLLTMRAQGVMIAICSKNNEADVWEVFDRHDGMVLKREHVVAHRINWLDKPSNIASLAEEMNIGVDSLVFVDDSSIEIDFVRQSLPMVTCVQVPEDLARFSSVVGDIRLFDREQLSEEDRLRSDMMVQERERRTLGLALDKEEFTKVLGLAVDFFAVKPEHVARVAQLTNKTNQFNLTTIRRTPAEISQLCDDPDYGVFAWRVADRFGDYGLVGAVILHKGADALEIDTLLMSCRVLGRNVERAIFSAIGDQAKATGRPLVRGAYWPTKKNVLVKDLYRDFGFEPVDAEHWETESLIRLAWPKEIARPGL